MLGNVVLGSLAIAIVLSAHAPTACGATHTTRQIHFDPDLVQIEEVPGGVVVRYPGAHATAPAGEADLPRTLHWVELPPGTRMTSIEVVEVETVELGRHRVAAAAIDRRPGEPESPAPETDLFARAGLQPASWAEIGHQGSMRGRRLAAVYLHPIRWEPTTGRLLLARTLRLAYTLVEDPTAVPLARHRIVPSIERRFERALRTFERSQAPGAGIVAAAGGAGDAGTGPAGDGPFQPTFRPSLDGSPVEYLVITNEALAADLQRLVDWKTLKGGQATLRTVEWIDDTYPNGVDRAERIRFFIRDAYQNWGTLFVVLAGDTDVIPARYCTITAPQPEQIPTDMYFGCLEGNWNLDGDDRFAEGINNQNPSPADEADLFFEVSVGRLPISNNGEARDYVDKLITYEIHPPSDPGYPASVLAMAERLFPASHGADKAEQALAYMPDWIHQVRLYEDAPSYPGSYELNAQTAIDSINAGYGMVLHIGHGYRNTMSVADGTINNTDIDNLTNGPRNSVVFAINCSSVSIDFNSIGERWLKNPDGGSLAYVGTSRLAYVTPSTIYMNEWFHLAYDDSVTSFGLVTDMARVVLAANAGFDGASRWNLMATLTLGDPELDFYTNAVIATEVSHASEFQLGTSNFPLTVTSNGNPVQGASVTLFKQDEAFASDTTDASGTANLLFRAETTGDAYLTVHKSYYRVYQDTLTVTGSPAAFVHIQSMTIDDDGSGASNGDDDGLADAGETIELMLVLKNAGGTTATNVTGTLTVVDPEGAITLLQDTVSYGNLFPGGASGGTGSYVLEIDPDAAVAYQPVLQLSITAGLNSWSDVALLSIHRPHLEHYAHTVDDALPRGNGNGVVESGEEIWYSIDLRNTGQHDMPAVTGRLRALGLNLQPHPLVPVADSTSAFGPIEVGETVTGDRFEFTLDGAVEPQEIQLEVTFSAPPYADIVQMLDVSLPGAPDSVRAFGSPSTITLKWEPPHDNDMAGYDVYRADNPFGPFDKINQHLVAGSAVFEDPGLPALERYYYQVVGRDSSYNAGPASAMISGSTNPPLHTGWPQEVGQQSPASPTIVDIDQDFRMEVLAAAEMQYAWHCDGSEVLDGDNDRRTSGPFTLDGRNTSARGFGATQAVGDLDDDGDMEIANVTMDSDSLFVWDHLGQRVPGFPKSVMDDYNWASLVMADVDLDGDLEILCWAGKGGRLFGWHHDGTEIVDGDNNPSTDGIITRIFGVSFSYATPAVANLDADPELEIVFAINISGDHSGGIYAYNIDGTPVAGWPVFTGESGFPSEVSASPAIGDIDNDGDMEIVVAAEREGGRVYIYHHDGRIFLNWPRPVAADSPYARLPSPVLADLNGDTFLDIIFPSTDGELYAWERNGSLLSGFPVQFSSTLSQATQCTPTVADVDGDGQLEILFGDEKGKVHGYNHDGTELNGFPIQTNGEVRGSVAIWDCDTDNLLEIVVMSYDTKVYVWDLPYDFHPDRMPWPMFGHDTRNTGQVDNDILPIGIADPLEGPGLLPERAALHEAVPNPFNPRTTIAFDVPGEANGARRVHLAIFDVNGRLVRELVDGPVEAGTHAVVWDGLNLRGGGAASGVYFVQLRVGQTTDTQKLVMLR